MRALLVESFKPFAEHGISDVPAPELEPGHLLVSMRAGGINFPDILMVEGAYQIKPPFPFVAGAEGAGVVEAIGEGVEGFSIGDRVAVMPGTGTFADTALVPAPATVPIPDSMSFEEAAGFVMVYGTSHHALADRADLHPGERVLVLGAAGGVGLAAVELAHAAGADVTAACSTKEKAEICREHGADHTLVYGGVEDLKTLFKDAAGKRGFDVIYDPVGDRFTEPAFRSISWGGRHLAIGFAAGDIPRLPLNLALLKGADIRGVFWGAHTQREPAKHRTNLDTLFAMYEAGQLRPRVSATYPLEDYASAMQALKDREVKGKVVLTMD